jgi:prephenate dehydratase
MAGSKRAEGARPHVPRVGYLGPEGTFSEEALLAGALEDAIEPVAFESFQDTVLALTSGDVEWAILPIENSLEGSVTAILDLLVENAAKVKIVAEELLRVNHFLIAADEMPLSEISRVLTHPQVPGQCRRFLREQLRHATVLPASSTADAVRIACCRGGEDTAAGGREGAVHHPDARAARVERTAAIGTRLAAQIYEGVVLCENIQDRKDNLTRFVWLGRREDGGTQAPPLHPSRLSGPLKASLVFWGRGADRPGWLVRCLDEFASRQINLTKIESRPQGGPLGHYMFFVDLEGDATAPPAANAIAGLSALCEQVLVLGCYRAARRPDDR